MPYLPSSYMRCQIHATSSHCRCAFTASAFIPLQAATEQSIHALLSELRDLSPPAPPSESVIAALKEEIWDFEYDQPAASYATWLRPGKQPKHGLSHYRHLHSLWSSSPREHFNPEQVKELEESGILAIVEQARPRLSTNVYKMHTMQDVSDIIPKQPPPRTELERAFGIAKPRDDEPAVITRRYVHLCKIRPAIVSYLAAWEKSGSKRAEKAKKQSNKSVTGKVNEVLALLDQNPVITQERDGESRLGPAMVGRKGVRFGCSSA